MQGATSLPYTSLNLARRVHSSQAQPTCFGHMTEARMANNPGFRPRSPPKEELRSTAHLGALTTLALALVINAPFVGRQSNSV